MGSADPPPLEKWMKNLKAKTCKKSSFLCLCYICRAIRAGRCRERRYADHIFIQIYFRMHHFVVKFSKYFRLRRQRGIDPPNQNPADVPVSTAADVVSFEFLTRISDERTSDSVSACIGLSQSLKPHACMSFVTFLSIPGIWSMEHLQCFDAVGWTAGRASGL